MKKAFLYGLISLALLAIISIFSIDLYLKITTIVGIGSVIISSLFLKVFIRGKEFSVNSNPKEEREDRRFGLVVAAFGAPFLITAIVILVF